MFGGAFDSIKQAAEDAKQAAEDAALAAKAAADKAAARSKAKLYERQTRLCAVMRSWQRMITTWTRNSLSRAVEAWWANFKTRYRVTRHAIYIYIYVVINAC